MHEVRLTGTTRTRDGFFIRGFRAHARGRTEGSRALAVGRPCPGMVAAQCTTIRTESSIKIFVLRETG